MNFTHLALPRLHHGRGNWFVLVVSTLLVAALASGCAGDRERENTLINDITKAYDTAQQSMANRNYRRAIQIFEALQARFPFSDLSKQIQLELMYAYYKSNKPEQAIDAADQFMRENPTHKRYDYALYVKGLAHFDDDPGLLERWFRRDISNRPPRDATLAFSLFRRLVNRYPASPWAADAEQRMVFLKNRLAAYDNSVAHFYLRHDSYVAAANRAKQALEMYNGSDSGEESLTIMIEAYEGLGMTELAADARRLRDANFPQGS